MAAQISELEAHRTALTGHCYRMLGSAVDADDAVQETMVRAWKSLDGFDGRSALRTWLYRVATNVCLDALAHRSRRERPISSAPKGTIQDVLEQRERAFWLEPIADAHAVASDESPAQQLILRQSIRLAFVATLQHLPPKQRAALILSDVLGWSAQETASCLETTVPAINSALQRARETLANADLDRVETLRPEHSDLVERYAAAFERYDVDALTSMLRQDAVLSMPPYTLWLQGHESIAAWFSGPGAGCRGSRLVPTVACGSPAFAQYRNGGRDPWALIVLELSDGEIASITSFMDVATVFPRFGMAMTLAP